MTSTLLTSALIIGAIIIFISLFNWLHKRQQQKQNKERKKFFYDFIQKNNLSIHHSEAINNYVFGIDKSGAKLLHLDFRNSQPAVTLIDLREVKSAKLFNVEAGIYETNKGNSILTEKFITKMQLAITLDKADQPPIMLPLYEYEDGMHNLVSLKQRGQYWQATINSYLQQLAVVP